MSDIPTMSSFTCGPVELESDDADMNSILVPFYDGLESLLSEQSEINKEVKLSCLLQLDDSFSTEDRWPI